MDVLPDRVSTAGVLAASEAALYNAPGALLLSNPVFPLLGVLLARLAFLPQEQHLQESVHRVLQALFVLALMGGAALLEMFYLFPRGSSVELETGISLYGILLLALAMGAVANIIVLVLRFVRMPRSYVRQQLLILLSFPVLAVVPGQLLTFYPWLLFDSPVLSWALSNLLLAFIPLGYAFVIFRRNYLRRNYLRLDLFMTNPGAVAGGWLALCRLLGNDPYIAQPPDLAHRQTAVRLNHCPSATGRALRQPAGAAGCAGGSLWPAGCVQPAAGRYNSFGQVIEVVQAAGTSDAVTTIYGYDAVGRLQTTTESSATESHTTLNVYDDGDRLMATIANWTGSDPALWQNDCDTSSGPRDTNVCTRYGYDAAGRTVATVANWDGSAYTTYDDLCDFVNPDSEHNVCSLTGYDQHGRVVSTTNALGHVARTFYDSLGRVAGTVENSVAVTALSQCAWTACCWRWIRSTRRPATVRRRAPGWKQVKRWPPRRIRPAVAVWRRIQKPRCAGLASRRGRNCWPCC